MIAFNCVQCARQLQAAEQLAGMNTRCPHCQTVQPVPPATVPQSAIMENLQGLPLESVTPTPVAALSENATFLPVARIGSESATWSHGQVTGLDQVTQDDVAQRSSEVATRALPGDGRESLRSLPMIPGYVILSELGRGGMGVVYKARQIKLNRLVALKMILAGGHAGAAELARFQNEAEAIARLQHPNIVQVHEVGEHEGKPYFSLEFCGGGSLAQKLHGTPLPPREAAALIETLARAMHAAHEHQIIHRDLKPANVLLLEDGTPKITDFGLAKKLDEAGQTQSGAIMGTPSYMAPEQAGGKTAELGPLTDVYALGAILYECLTGRPPFKAANAMDTVLQVAHDEPVPPTRLQPKTPRDLETICLKCLRKEPGKRYATAAALADELARFQRGEPILAHPVGALERGWRWCRRQPLVASLVGAVAGLLVAVAVVSTVSAMYLKTALNDTKAAERDTRAALGKAEGAEHETRLALGKTEAAQRQARLREAEALIGQARGIAYSRRPGQRFQSLEALSRAVAIGRELEQPADWFDPLRNTAIAALALPDLHIGQSWPIFPADSSAVELSDDFEWYARTTSKGGCSIRRVADDAEVFSLPELGQPALARFGPGRLLFIHGYSGGRFQLWDLTGSKPALRLNEQNIALCWSFRPNDGQFALCRNDGTITVHALKTAAVRHRLAAGNLKATWVALHPAAALVAASSYHANLLQVRDLASGAVLVSEVLPWRGSAECAWSPDGCLLAVSEGDGGRVQLYAFDPVARKLQATHMLQALGNGGTALQFNPAGDRLVVRGWNDKVHFFDVHTGRLLLTTPALSPVSRNDIPLRFDARGERLAAVRVGKQQERVGVWSVAEGREYLALGHANNDPEISHGRPAIHPGSRLGAQGLHDGVGLFDLNTGRELAFLKIPGKTGCVCFDGVGNLLSNSSGGFFRWPVRPDPTRPHRLFVGPPERLPFNPGTSEIAASHDGRVVAQSMWRGYGMLPFAGGWILSPNSQKPRWVEPGWSAGKCDVSPDGRWAAFGALGAYETATGRRVWNCPDGNSYCRFSADGRWLLTDSDGGRVYAVPTWELGPRFGPGCPWDLSPDGRLVVVGETDGIYRLVELATGRELARLEAPDQVYGPAVFSPDGTCLVVGADDGLRVWDLRRLRAGLAMLGIDWEAPPYPAAPVESALLEVTVVGGDLVDPKKMAAYQRNQAVIDLYVNPFDAEAHLRHAASLLSTGREEAGQAHLRVALALRPDLAQTREHDVQAALRLSGEAYARRARWKEAVADFTHALEVEPDEHWNWYYAVVLHAHLGNKDEYRRLCQKMLERFGGTTDPYIAERTAKGCSLMPGVFDEPQKLARLATLAVTKDPNHTGIAWFYMSRGLTEYRLGHPADAAVWLEKSLAKPPNAFGEASARFVLGMCQQQQGQTDAAKATLTKAQTLTAQQSQRNWLDWLINDQLRREAESRITGKNAEPGK